MVYTWLRFKTTNTYKKELPFFMGTAACLLCAGLPSANPNIIQHTKLMIHKTRMESYTQMGYTYVSNTFLQF
jgi:hypothetical protein